MKRDDVFRMRVTEEERDMIAAISNHMERNASDAIRFIIREIARNLTDESKIVQSEMNNAQRPEYATV